MLNFLGFQLRLQVQDSNIKKKYKLSLQCCACLNNNQCDHIRLNSKDFKFRFESTFRSRKKTRKKTKARDVIKGM